MAGAKAFKLYRSLLSDKARQTWEEIIKTEVTLAPWEGVNGVMHTETPIKTWNSFDDCVMLHLQQVFGQDAGETLKFYITNTL